MSLKVISQNTAVKRIATYVGIGIAGAIIYTTINNTVNSNAELDYKQKIEVINEAINKKDTKLAKKVFEELEQNKIFKGGDESKFELTIKRIEDINNFENTIAEEKIDSALVLLAKVKKKGFTTKTK